MLQEKIKTYYEEREKAYAKQDMHGEDIVDNALEDTAHHFNITVEDVNAVLDDGIPAEVRALDTNALIVELQEACSFIDLNNQYCNDKEEEKEVQRLADCIDEACARLREIENNADHVYSFDSQESETDKENGQEYTTIEGSGKCGCCNWECQTVYFHAHNVKEAVQLINEARKENGNGLCGQCFTEMLTERGATEHKILWRNRTDEG